MKDRFNNRKSKHYSQNNPATLDARRTSNSSLLRTVRKSQNEANVTHSENSATANHI